MIKLEDVVVGGIYRYKSGYLEYRVKVLSIHTYEIRAEWTEVKDPSGNESHKVHPNLGHTKSDWKLFPMTKVVLNKGLEEYL